MNRASDAVQGLGWESMRDLRAFACWAHGGSAASPSCSRMRATARCASRVRSSSSLRPASAYMVRSTISLMFNTGAREKGMLRNTHRPPAPRLLPTHALLGDPCQRWPQPDRPHPALDRSTRMSVILLPWPCIASTSRWPPARWRGPKASDYDCPSLHKSATPSDPAAVHIAFEGW